MDFIFILLALFSLTLTCIQSYMAEYALQKEAALRAALKEEQTQLTGQEMEEAQFAEQNAPADPHRTPHCQSARY